MTRRRLRRFAPVLMVGVVALAASGCSSTMNDAATITSNDANGAHTTHIARADFLSQLHALVSNQKASSAQLAGDRTNTTDQRAAAFWLGQLVFLAAVDAEFRAHNLSVTPADRDAAKQLISGNLFPQQVFAGFAPSLQNQLLDGWSRLAAVIRYYESCPSGRFVEHILLRTHDDAEAAFNQIRAGQPFGTVAKAKSIDTGSAQAGGALGCLTPGEFVPEFQTAAKQVPFDTVTVPVKTKFGYHLILVRHWDPVADQGYVQALDQAARTAVFGRLAQLHVRLDPRFGTGRMVSDGQGGISYVVTPPAVPDVRDQREKSAANSSTTTVPAGG